MGMGPNLNTQMGIYIEPNMSNPGQTHRLLIMRPQHYPPGPTTWSPLKWAEEYPTANPPRLAALPILTPLSATELGYRGLLMYPHPYPLDWGKGGIPQPHRNITATSTATALTPLPLTHHPFFGNPPCRRQFQCRPLPAGYPRGVQEVEGERPPSLQQPPLRCPIQWKSSNNSIHSKYIIPTFFPLKAKQILNPHLLTLWAPQLYPQISPRLAAHPILTPHPPVTPSRCN